jgi:hypothetical protein
MGQAQILSWFEAHPGWHDVAEVSKCLDREKENARKIIGKLVRWKELECMTEKGKKFYKSVNIPRGE